MRLTQSVAISAIALSMMVPNISWARSELDSRVSRLENIVANELNIKLIEQLNALQQEISELRGKLEEQQNSVQGLDQKQQKLFTNLDSRLNNLNSTTEAAKAVATTPVTAVITTTAVAPVEQTTTNVAPETPAQLPIEDEVAKYAPTSEKPLFDSAYGLMADNKYPEAITGFKDLLWQYPEGTYACQAYYWLGELYMVQWQSNRTDVNLLAQAKEAFTTITNKYQGQDKESDAMLKLGVIEFDLEHWAVATEIFQKLISKYPNTASARIAESNLKRMELKL